ncbi:MAG: hypothetical protein EPO61_13680 [Nitrospirae bacterium]|nr:MAG: hypothetical protein EPO61_13680 [Nitrospirota bacterium]
MKTSIPTADTPLRQTWPLVLGGQASGLAARSVDILFKDASLPRDSTRPSRQASQRFHYEPS